VQQILPPPRRLPALSVRQTFAALKHPNYRLWFYGQLVSLIGTWMQNTAQGFLIYQLTHSAAFLGYVGFAAGLPAWVFTLYAGVIADRMPRRRLMMFTQTAMMLLAFALAALVFTHVVRPWHIIVLALGLGIANAFDAPARQAFAVELIDREDLTNAIALNSTMFNAATVVGPAVAGITYAAFGAGWCFTINAISYVAVIGALALMRLAPFTPLPRRASITEHLKEGLGYVRSDRASRALITAMGVFSLFAVGAVTLMPAWAVKVLHGDVKTNGALLSFRGAGALAGALMIAALGRHVRRGRLLTLGSFALPAALLLFAPIRLLPLSLLILVAVGWGFMVMVNSINALLQTRVPDALRGRVMSLYTLVFFGGMPLGSLLMGQLAHALGEPAAVAIGGVLMLGAAGFYWLRVPELREMR
jgi:predicted MFS family arabinose efflux permease